MILLLLLNIFVWRHINKSDHGSTGPGYVARLIYGAA